MASGSALPPPSLLARFTGLTLGRVAEGEDVLRIRGRHTQTDSARNGERPSDRLAVRHRFAHGPASAVITVSLLLGACTDSGSSDDATDRPAGSEDSGADGFCDVWWESAVDLRGRWSETSNEDPVASLLLLISAPNDLARHFERAAGVAPEEIRGDLQALAEHFDEALDDAGDLVGDPLSFLVGSVVSGAGVAGSFERVDSYVSENCPVPADLAGAAGATTSAACERVTATDVDATSNVDDLVEFLADAEAATPEAVEASRSLRSAVLELDPPARFGFEALGRLRFEDFDVDGTFAELVSAAVDACAVRTEDDPLTGSGGTDDLIADLLDSIGPRPDQQLSVALYGRCDSQRLLAPNSSIYACGNTIESVDLDTGQVTVLNATMPTRGFRPDGRGGWNLDITEHPASGLAEPAWSASVSYVDFSTGEGRSLTLVDHRPGVSPLTPNGPYLEVVYADEVAVVVVSQPTDDDSFKLVTARAWDGSTLGERRADGYYALISPVILDGPSIAFVGYQPSLLFDAHTGEVVLESVDGFLGAGVTECPDGDFVFDDDTDEVFRVSGTPSTVTPLGISVAQGQRIGAGLLTRDEGGYAFLGHDGTELWSLPETVVTDAQVVFGWIVARNLSGENVVVDPRTGAEAAVPPTLASLLTTIYSGRSSMSGSSVSIELIDPASDTVFVGRGGSQIERLLLSDMCP